MMRRHGLILPLMRAGAEAAPRTTAHSHAAGRTATLLVFTPAVLVLLLACRPGGTLHGDRDVGGNAGEIKGFTGIDDPYEAPANPEILVDTEATSPGDAAGQVLAYLETHGYLRA